MDCTTCNKQVSTMAVGTGVYCRDCGTRLDKNGTPATATATATGRRTETGSDGVQTSATSKPVGPRTRPAARGSVLDLRQARPEQKRGTVRIGGAPVTATVSSTSGPVRRPTVAPSTVAPTAATPVSTGPLELPKTSAPSSASMLAHPSNAQTTGSLTARNTPVAAPAERAPFPVVHSPHPHTINHSQVALRPSATLESEINHSHTRTSMVDPSLERAAAKAGAEGELHAYRPAVPAARHHTSDTLPRFTNRFERAKTVPRSGAIGKFHVEAPADEPVAPAASAGRELPAHAVTHHEALTRLVNSAPSLHLPDASSRRGRVVAVAASIAVLSGYVWMHNYPKFSIASAGNTAGITASLPGYMPSSFTLKRTNAQPGLVTLSFASPNQTTPLNIDQRQTDWDSKSLLDNYVAKTASDYAAIDGQGLTVYLFGQNQASWINHGVWYSISNASRLSREQVLKIAYSL